MPPVVRERGVMSWLDDAQARIAAAKLIVDDDTRIALWRLVLDARQRNHDEAGIVRHWLLSRDLHEPEATEDLKRARRRIAALGPPWQLQEPSGKDRNYYISEPADWNDKCGYHFIQCRSLEVVHNELDEIEKVAANARREAVTP
jgi:hypothetical protein